MKMTKLASSIAALLLAAPLYASLPTPVDPHGADSGVGRMLAALPTVVDPSSPNSGMGRSPLTEEPTSGAGRTIA